MIEGIAREAVQQQGADPGRVFVAGLSAGAAMAVVLGETYPELFAGLGAHSGLPYGSARDLPSALAVMKGRRSGRPELDQAQIGAGSSSVKAVQSVPIIVFHGDRDYTVKRTNGDEIARQALEAHAFGGNGEMRATASAGVASGGRQFSRTVHTDTADFVRVEIWILHGGGHAWSGGHASGTYTDGNGPDASAEMVRFFLALPSISSAGVRQGEIAES